MDEVNLSAAVGQALDGVDPRLRQQVLESVDVLTRAGLRTAEAALSSLKDSSADPEIRLHACSVLSWIRYAPCKQVLLTLLGKETDEALVWEVAKAIVRLADPSVASALLDYLERGSDLAAAAAAWSIGQRHDADVVAALVRAVADRHRGAIVRDHAAEALGALEATEAVDALIGALRDESPDVRYSAAYALGEIGDVKALQQLKQHRRDTEKGSAGPVSEAVESALAAVRKGKRARRH